MKNKLVVFWKFYDKKEYLFIIYKGDGIALKHNIEYGAIDNDYRYQMIKWVKDYYKHFYKGHMSTYKFLSKSLEDQKEWKIIHRKEIH